MLTKGYSIAYSQKGVEGHVMTIELFHEFFFQIKQLNKKSIQKTFLLLRFDFFSSQTTHTKVLGAAYLIKWPNTHKLKKISENANVPMTWQ